MAIVSAMIAASVALVVAVLTPAVTSLRARREAINAQFDAAVSALLLVQAARHIATGIDRRYYPGTDDEYQQFKLKMPRTRSQTSFTRPLQHAEFWPA